MKKQDEIPKRPFTSGFLADDLSDWAGKLMALGGMLSALSSQNGGTEALEQHVEDFGNIIMDYADLIKTAVDENVGQVNGNKEGADAQLSRHQEAFNILKNAKRPEDILAINYHLNELSEFIHNISTPAIALKNDFDDLKKAIMAKQEKAA